MRLTEANRDYYAGALMLVIGSAVAWQGFGYNVGSLTRMGPGFFPVALGVLLAALGIAIAAGFREASRRRHGTVVEGRTGMARVGIDLAIGRGVCRARQVRRFAAGDVRDRLHLGARRSRQHRARALLLALAMCAVAVVVFWWLLQLRLPLFGWG